PVPQPPAIDPRQPAPRTRTAGTSGAAAGDYGATCVAGTTAGHSGHAGATGTTAGTAGRGRGRGQQLPGPTREDL
ncbi:hypothetical protein ACETWP_17390, partial [Arthrobacter halodurans]